MKNLRDIVRNICYGRNRHLFVKLYNLTLYAPTIFCLTTGNFDALSYTVSIAFVGDMLYVIVLIATASDDIIVVSNNISKNESKYLIKLRSWFSSMIGNKFFNFIL